VGEHMDLRITPGHKLAIHPNPAIPIGHRHLGLQSKRKGNLPILTKPARD
jgi:hypothetical protein